MVGIAGDCAGTIELKFKRTNGGKIMQQQTWQIQQQLQRIQQLSSEAVQINQQMVQELQHVNQQLAISRSREYKADEGAAKLTRDPDGLADALAKLDHVSRFGTGRRREERNSAATAALAHMYIVNPLRGQNLAGLFSTHPPTEERIRRLRLMRINDSETK